MTKLVWMPPNDFDTIRKFCVTIPTYPSMCHPTIERKFVLTSAMPLHVVVGRNLHVLNMRVQYPGHRHNVQKRWQPHQQAWAERRQAKTPGNVCVFARNVSGPLKAAFAVAMHVENTKLAA